MLQRRRRFQSLFLNIHGRVGIGTDAAEQVSPLLLNNSKRLIALRIVAFTKDMQEKDQLMQLVLEAGVLTAFLLRVSTISRCLTPE
jgi:hypothetical protein